LLTISVALLANVFGRSCLHSLTRIDLAVPQTKTSTYRPHSFADLANKLELTTSIVLWCNPDTRTIPTQTETSLFRLA